MKHTLIERYPISIFLTEIDQQQAREIAELAPTAEQAEQWYRNALSVLACKRCLSDMDVPSDLERSYSFNPAIRLIHDVADLYIPEARGRIECRPMHEGEDKCYFPEEVRTGRIGYIVVELSNDCTKATVQGFVPNVSKEHLPLGYLQPLNNIFEHLEPPEEWNPLEWLRGQAEEGWKHISKQAGQLADGGSDTLLANPPLSPVRSGISVRGGKVRGYMRTIQTTTNEKEMWTTAEKLWKESPEQDLETTGGEWEIPVFLAERNFALRVAILPRNSGREWRFRLRANEAGEAFVPADLELAILDQSGQELISQTASGNFSYIQLMTRQPSADQQESFSIQIKLDSDSIIEKFTT